jgi:hypothetical protein
MDSAVAPKSVPRRPKAADHLIAPQHNVMFIKNLLNFVKVFEGGTMTPPAPLTGSAINAAMVSGPSARISASSSSARRCTNSASLSPGCRRGSKCGEPGAQDAQGIEGQLEVRVVGGQSGQGALATVTPW